MAKKSAKAALSPSELAALNLLIEEMKENPGLEAAGITDIARKVIDKARELTRNERFRQVTRVVTEEVVRHVVQRTIHGAVAKVDSADIDELKATVGSLDKEPTLEELIAIRDRLSK